MAYIPVEKKKRRFPWWLLLLLLLLPAALALILWGLYDEYQEEPEPVAYETTVMEDEQLEEPIGEPVEEPTAIGEPPPTQGTITNVETLTQAADLAALAGRQVQLSDMRVTNVVGDAAFIVEPTGEEAARKFLVLLEEEPTPGTQVEGRYDVTQGQVVTIHGEIHELEAERPALGLRGVTPEEIEPVADDNVLLFARRLDITERP